MVILKWTAAIEFLIHGCEAFELKMLSPEVTSFVSTKAGNKPPTREIPVDLYQ